MRTALRNLYFSRAAFAAVWVALASAAGSSGGSRTSFGLGAAALLLIYPMSDVVGTAYDLRSNRSERAKLLQRLNVFVSLAAALMIGVTAARSVEGTMTVFAGWAIVVGSLQLLVGVRRLHVLGGQWPMIISGAGSVFGGTTFLGWTLSASAAMHTLIQYSVGGAVWYVLSALWLMRPTTPAERVAPPLGD